MPAQNHNGQHLEDRWPQMADLFLYPNLACPPAQAHSSRSRPERRRRLRCQRGTAEPASINRSDERPASPSISTFSGTSRHGQPSVLPVVPNSARRCRAIRLPGQGVQRSAGSVYRARRNNPQTHPWPKQPSSSTAMPVYPSQRGLHCSLWQMHVGGQPADLLIGPPDNSSLPKEFLSMLPIGTPRNPRQKVALKGPAPVRRATNSVENRLCRVE